MEKPVKQKATNDQGMEVAAPSSPPLKTVGGRTTRRILCTRAKLEASLRRRRFLSCKPVVAATFLFFLASATILLSRTLYAQYDPWNIPSILSGMAAAALGWPVLVWLRELLKNARGRKQSRTVSAILRTSIRRGYGSIAFLTLGLGLTAAIAALPARDLLRQVHDKIGIGGSGNLKAASELFARTIGKTPSYSIRPGAACLDAVIDALLLEEKNTPYPKDYWDNIIERASSGAKDKRGFVRDWSAFVVALAEFHKGKHDEAKAALLRLASCETTDRIVRYRAYERLGNLAYTQNNLEDAKICFLQAMQFGATTVICENLGSVFQDQQLFDLATPFYERAQRIEESQGTNQENRLAAVHFANLASFYNNYARFSQSQETGDVVSDSKLRERYRNYENLAKTNIKKALTLDPSNLEFYWTAALFLYDVRKVDESMEWIDKAKELLNRKDPQAREALARNDYATIGPFYTAWLKLRVLSAVKANPDKIASAVDELAKSVEGFENDPFRRLLNKIVQVQKSGHVDYGDLPALTNFSNEGLFEAHKMPVFRSPSRSTTNEFKK